MFHVALLEPEIPANTGNVGRLVLGVGATLHLVGPCGFRLDESAVRRAGVDHWKDVHPVLHPTLADFEASREGGRIFCFSVRGKLPYTAPRYQPGDALLFGRESTGLPAEVVERYGERALFVPMPAGRTRSLNLSNAVAVAVYEALRQTSGW